MQSDIIVFPFLTEVIKGNKKIHILESEKQEIKVKYKLKIYMYTCTGNNAMF